MLVGFAEGLGAAKTYAARTHYEIDANRELLGLGAANLGAGAVAAAWWSTAACRRPRSTARPGPERRCRALVVAVLTVVTLLFLTGLFEDLPEATLAAVVIAAVIELVDIPALTSCAWPTRPSCGRIYGVAARPDFIAAVAALLGVLVFDTLPGPVHRHRRLAGAARVPGLAPARRGARPGAGAPTSSVDLDRDTPSNASPGVVVLRPESGLFFANAEAVPHADPLRRVAEAHAAAVVLDAETVPTSTSPPCGVLDELAADLGRQGRRAS